MSKKEKLGKREKLRTGFAILSALVTIACGAVVAFNTTFTMSSIVMGFVLSVGALSATTFLGLTISRAVSRNIAIKKGKQDALDAIKTIDREFSNPSLSKEISRQIIIKNYNKYLSASLKLCKNRGFAFTGYMKEMIPSTNPDRSSMIAEKYFVQKESELEKAIGDKNLAQTEKKITRLRTKLTNISKKNGEVLMAAPAYEDKYVIPELGLEIPGINKINATSPAVISEFEKLAKNSAKEDFGSMLKIDYKNDDFKPTFARYSDTNKTLQVEGLLLKEVEYLVQKHGEESLFPIELTLDKDLGKNHRLQNKKNKTVVRFKSLDEFRNQISGMER